jgi:hypothetical protein
MGIIKLVALVIKTSSASRRAFFENSFSLNLNLWAFKILINLFRVQPFNIL